MLSFRASFIVICAAWCLVSAAAGQSSWIDSVAEVYDSAARTYDSTLLRYAVDAIERRSPDDRQSPRALLLRGLAYWRLELIAYCIDDNDGIVRYGKKALEILEQAEKAGSDAAVTGSHKSLVCQLIAGLGFRRAVTYGPRSAAELKKAGNADSTGYFYLLASAVSTSRAPKFAGGDPVKAAAMLEKMKEEFSDSVDVMIHLARAYVQTGRNDEARKIMAPVIEAHPENLFAQMAAREAGLVNTE
jgi:tetratricopeptide (TPR) repeat protein